MLAFAFARLHDVTMLVAVARPSNNSLDADHSWLFVDVEAGPDFRS